MIKLFLVSLVLALSGCANLKEVRDFTKESAKLAAYTELTNRFVSTSDRQQAYDFNAATTAANLENDKERKAAKDTLLGLHKIASNYMKTLAQLAGEDTFVLDKEIEVISTSLKAFPNLGVKQDQIDAATKVVKVVVQWALAAAQEKAVKQMLNEGGPDAQKVLDGLVTVAVSYKGVFENEKATILEPLNLYTAVPPDGTAKDKMLWSIAREARRAKAIEYEALSANYKSSLDGLRAVAAGHEQMRGNIDKLDSYQVKAILKKLKDDVQTARESLQVLN